MNFKTAYFRGETTESPLGSDLVPTYSYRIDKKTGKRRLEKTGETNIYERIQANLESSKLENIVKRCTGGDLSALQIKDGSYIDISEIPTNMIEIQNVILRCKDEFDKLPAEIRNKFDNSAEKFVSEYGSEIWADKMGYFKEEAAAPTPENNEVKEVVNNE